MTTTDALFCSLTPLRLAELVRSARHAVCYAGPGLQLDLAQAMVEVAGRVGKEMLTVSLDFDDRVMRMGYGNVEAVKLLLDAGIAVQSSPGLRTALVVVDDAGYIFTPTALYLEAEPTRRRGSSYAVFCLKKKKTTIRQALYNELKIFIALCQSESMLLYTFSTQP